MSSSGGSWRVAGRLARREVRRHPWRHLLVTVLILVPVLAALAAFSVITTWGDVDARQESFLSPGPEYVTYSTDQNARSIASTDLELPEVQKRIGLPKGTPTEVSWSGSDWLLGSRQRADKQGPLLVSADMIEAPDRSLRASEFVVSDGRLPAREGEIFVTDAVARKGGWSKGDTVASARSGREFRIVGTGVLGAENRSQAAAVADLPASYWVQPLVGLGGINDFGQYDEPTGQRLTARIADPSLEQDLRGGGFYREERIGEIDGRLGAGLTMIAAAICAVVAVVASAALAISSRKQLRTIGLLSTVGTDPATVRRAMILQGAIPGLIAGVAAVIVATAGVAAINAAGVVERYSEVEGARASLSPKGSIIVIVLGLASGIAAAWQPARTASRIPTLSALAGRRPVGPVPSRVPVSGAILWACGACALLIAFASDGEGTLDGAVPFLIIGGVAAIALGGVGLAPLVVASLDPLARRAHGTWRMGLRGLARHRMQSAATVAAIGVVLAVPVGLLTARNGLDEIDHRVNDECCAETQTTSFSPPTAEQAVFRGGVEPALVDISGALRTPAGPKAATQVVDALGPEAAVIRTIPIVDQDGEWQQVATVDPAVAEAVLVPWAAKALAEGKAITTNEVRGPVSFTAAGDTATFEVQGPPEGGQAYLPLDATYVVSTEALGDVGAERPASRLMVMRADSLTDPELLALQKLPGFAGNQMGIPNPPTLAQVQAAVAAGAAGAESAGEGAPEDTGVAIEIWSDGTEPRYGSDDSETRTSRDEWATALLVMAVVSGVLALLVLTITLSLRAVDGEADRRAAYAAGVSPAALRHQRAFEGVVLALLGALLAIPLGWIPVTAARLGADDVSRTTDRWLTSPGWEVVPILLAPAVLAAVLWTVIPAATAAVRSARHRDLPDDLIPRW